MIAALVFLLLADAPPKTSDDVIQDIKTETAESRAEAEKGLDVIEKLIKQPPCKRTLCPECKLELKEDDFVVQIESIADQVLTLSLAYNDQSIEVQVDLPPKDEVAEPAEVVRGEAGFPLWAIIVAAVSGTALGALVTGLAVGLSR